MLKLLNPRLRRSNVVLNSFGSCISNTSKEFSRTPEVSMSEMVSQPGMLFKKLKGRVAFKQLKGFANTHSRRKLNKQVDMISSDMQLINLKSSSVSNLSDKEFTINLQSVELKGISCVFNFPDKMESILSKAMLPRFQIHFSSPKPAHANFTVYFEEPSIQALPNSQIMELNFMEDGDSSLL